MREHSEEHSLLIALAERLAERRVLVTFNGKSFDWPLLETRYRMTRTIRAAGSARASGFPASGAKSLAVATWFGALAGTRKARARLESRSRRDFRADSADLFRLSSRRARPNRWFRSFITTRWTCGGWQDSRRASFHWSETRKRTGRMRSNFSASRGFANGAAKICARESSTSGRSLSSCRPKRIGWRGDRSRALQNGREITLLACSLWEGMLGNSREGFRSLRTARDPLRTPCAASRNGPRHSRERRSPNSARPNRLGTIARAAYRRGRARFEKRLARLERRAGRTLLDTMEAESRTPAGESNPETVRR